MRKVLGTALAILLIGFVGLAAAGEHKGKIISFDSGDRLVEGTIVAEIADNNPHVRRNRAARGG